MKNLYFECKMGVAGDMMAAALLGLMDDEQKAVDSLNEIGIPGVEYRLSKVTKCGILGNHLSVLIGGTEEVAEDGDAAFEHHEGHNHAHELHHDGSYEINDHIHDHGHEHGHDHAYDHSHEHDHEHDHDHVHRSLYEIEDIIENLNVSKEVKSDIREVYELLAEAESTVHGAPVSQIHFHEVGNMDAIADITAVCYLMHALEPDRIIVSPINVGSGTVKCAHGILPVPAPATAYLLTDIPSYESSRIESELCTPTGAALVKYFADEFEKQPVMTVKNIAYGMGKKDFIQANALRAVLGVSADENEQIVELSCNIDDMTPEEVGFATERLFKAGALEVYTVSADMKKNRPGLVFFCICKLEDREEMLQLMFANTTTLGIREHICNRYTLSRAIEKIDTPYGEIRVKRSTGYNVDRSKLEYEDLAGIAETTGKPILELKKELGDLK